MQTNRSLMAANTARIASQHARNLKKWSIAGDLATVEVCGQTLTIDASNLPLIGIYSWRMTSWGYFIAKINGGSCLIHRRILGLSKCDPDIDHINGNKADNRKANLRLATDSFNQLNSGPRNGRKYKGAYASGSKWRSSAHINGKTYRLGTWNTEEEAARAYDAFADKTHGQYAYKNFKD